MKLLLSCVIAIACLSCGNNEVELEKKMQKAEQDTANFTTINWLDTTLSFGSVKQGEVIKLKFRCVNTGNKPLLLTNVKPGCGCTVADYSKEAILSNKEGWVMASFDTKKYCGDVHKSIAASSNSKNIKEITLKFTGTITNCESNDKVVQPHPMPNEKH
jgi:Protein of unknown function (DUF1573)